MKKLTIRICGALILGLFIWQGCKKSDFESPQLAEHDTEFAFPLFNTELMVGDLVNNILQDDSAGDAITVNPDHTITVSYSGDVTESKAISILEFFKQTLPFPMDTSYYELPLDIPNGVNIQLAYINGGKISVVLVNYSTETINGTFHINQLTKDGVPYAKAFTMAPGSAFGDEIDMTGRVITAVDNRMILEYEAFLPDGTELTRLPQGPGGTVPAYLLMQELSFSYVQGFWDKVEYDLNTDTIEIDINQIDLNGNVKVKNPKVTITVFNSWGFPTRGLIKYLRFKAKNGDLLELQSPLIQQGTEVGIDFGYPSFTAGEVGQTKATVFYFDDTNSNIADIFNAQPVEMIYRVTGLANPENDPNLIGFITDSSTIRMNVKVELLLEGQLEEFPAEQSISLDFGSLTDSTGFESAEFKLVTENRMPLTTAMQIYFRDANDINVDSLFADGPTEAIRSAPVDAVTGLTTGTTRTETFIPFTAARFENLRRNAKKAYLKANFTTAENGTIPVKILDTQGAVVKMGIRLKR